MCQIDAVVAPLNERFQGGIRIPDQALEVGAFEFDDENVDTLTSILELRIGTEVPTDYVTLVPVAFARYFHEFENDSQEIEAAVVDPFGQLLDGTAVFRTNKPDRNYFAVGAGLQLFMMGNLSTQLGYDILLGHEFREEQNIGLTIRWGF